MIQNSPPKADQPKAEKLQSKAQSSLILAIFFLLPVYLIKIKFGWASFNFLELLIIALFLIWIFNKERKYLILDTKYFIPTLLILAGLVLSVLANKNYYTGFGAIKGWFVFPIIFGIIFHYSLIERDSLLKKSLWALFLSGTAVSVTGIVYEVLGIVTYDNRLKLFWDSPNQLAMFLAVPFLVGASLSLSSNSGRLLKFGLGLSVLLIGLDLYFTKSYGAWAAVLVALSLIFWLRYGRVWRKRYLAVFLAILLIFFGWASRDKFESIKSLGERSSLASRLTIWRSAGLMIENNPLFGIGAGNFQSKYLEYQKFFPPYLEWAAPQPHNLYLAFWLEAGLAGLLGFIWLLVLFFLDSKKAIKNNRLVGALCFAVMLYFLVHGLVDTTYWRNDMAIVFWTIMAINAYLAEFSRNGLSAAKLKLKNQNSS